MQPLICRRGNLRPRRRRSAGLDSPTRVRVAMKDGPAGYPLLRPHVWSMNLRGHRHNAGWYVGDERDGDDATFVPERCFDDSGTRRASPIGINGRCQNLIRNQDADAQRIALGDDAGTEYYVSEKVGRAGESARPSRDGSGAISAPCSTGLYCHARCGRSAVFLGPVRHLGGVAHRATVMCGHGHLHRRLERTRSRGASG